MSKARPSKSFKSVSEAELALLEVLWKAPAGPNELHEKLAKKGPDRAYTTIQTLLHRLLKKGYVTRKREGVTQVYTASVDREELVARHVADLAQRLCQGAMSPLLSSLVKTKRFTKTELSRFRQILDEAEGP